MKTNFNQTLKQLYYKNHFNVKITSSKIILKHIPTLTGWTDEVGGNITLTSSANDS